MSTISSAAERLHALHGAVWSARPVEGEKDSSLCPIGDHQVKIL